MSHSRIPDLEPPYGMYHFLRPADVQERLDIGSDTLARIRPSLHILELANGTRIFPTDYVAGLMGHADDNPKASMQAVARSYARTEQAAQQIGEAEEGFEQALVRSLRGGADERLLSAEAIARLLGFRRTAVKDWSLGRLSLETNHFMGVADLWFKEQTFRGFYKWQRPDVS